MLSNLKSKQPRESFYPRMTKLKSCMNQARQKLMGFGLRQLEHLSTRPTTGNMYLSGMYAPVPETTQWQFEIQGKIPTGLNGLLLRSGPNPLNMPQPDLHHWFMGDGMLHGLKLQQGQVKWFKSKYIQTDTIQKSYRQPLKPGFRRGPSDLVNTNAFVHANKIWAMIEAGTYPARLDFDLNTEYHGLFNSDADLPYTAHPHRDPATGHIHAICYDAMDLFNVYYEVFDELGRLLHVCKIPLRDGVMIHDCAITERDILIFDFPVTFSAKRLAKGYAFPYAWNENHPARIGVLPLYGQADQIQWIQVDPCFVFHAANAYRDEHDQIVVDMVVHDHMFKYSAQGPLEQQQVCLERWTILPETASLKRELLDAAAQEFPRIDERVTGRQHRYIYSSGFEPQDPTAANVLIIHDLQQCQKTDISLGDDWLVGEAVFVEEKEQGTPDTPCDFETSTVEGQGYLLAYAHHRQGQASKVCIFQVHGLEYQLQAEIMLRSRVPLGFHTSWIPLKPADG